MWLSSEGHVRAEGGRTASSDGIGSLWIGQVPGEDKKVFPGAAGARALAPQDKEAGDPP